MVETTDNDTYKKHHAWIRYSKAYYDKKFKSEADRYIEYFSNKFPKVTENDETQVYFNYFNMNVKRMLPQLAPLNVKFNLKPKGGDMIPTPGTESLENPQGVPFNNRRAVMIEEETLNNDIWKDKQIKYQVKFAEQVALITNFSGVEIFWQTEIEEKEEVPEETKNLLAEKIKNGEAIEGEAPVAVSHPVPKVDKLMIKYLEHGKVFVDPESKDPLLEDARYVVKLVEMNEEDAKGKPFWGELKDKKPTKMLDSEVMKLTDDKELPINRFYQLNYVYDRRQMKVFIYYKADGKPLHSQDLDAWPFRFLRFNLEPDKQQGIKIYPSSDFKCYETQAQEKALYRTAIANQLNRRLPRKIIYDTNIFGEEEIKKLKNSVDMEYVGVDFKGRNLDQVFKDIVHDPVQMDVMALSKDIDGEVQLLSQVNAMRLGAAKSQAATTSAIVNQAFQEGITEKTEIVKDFCHGIAETSLELLKKKIDESQDIELENEEGQKEWTKWSKRDIQYAKELIEVDLTPPIPTEAKAQREENFMNLMLSPILAQSLAQYGKRINYDYLITSFVDISKSNKDLEKLIIDVPQMPDDPLEENERMMNGGMAQVAEGQNHMEHFQKHMRFMQSPIFRMLPPEVQDIFLKHLQITREALMATMPVKPGKPALRPDMMNQGGGAPSGMVPAEGMANAASPGIEGQA